MSKLTLNDREKIAVYASTIEKVEIPKLSLEYVEDDILLLVLDFIKRLEKLAGEM